MEIITILKANIRHKKGSFISIILMMTIISLALTSFLSIRESCKTSINEALAYADAPNITAYFYVKDIDEGLLSGLRSHNLVDRVEQVDTSSCYLEHNHKTNWNQCFVQRYDSSRIRRLREDAGGYSEKTDMPKKGEIFVTQGHMERDDFKIGDVLKVYNSYYAGEPVMELRVAGIVVEPVNGASVMGWKQAFVNDADFETLTEQAEEQTAILKIYKKKGCSLNDRQFRRQLNLDTSVIDRAQGSMLRWESLYYTDLFPETIVSILLVFLVFLTVIVLIMIRHSIATSVEIDYVNLGVLKAMGFTKGNIRMIFVLQYLTAQVIGASAGFLLGMPVARLFGDLFQPITGIPTKHSIALFPSLAILAGVLLLSGLFIFFSTRKIGEISPIRAIAGGRREIYFDSRLKAPISKRLLSPSLALRQVTSNKRRYVSTMVVASILVFFMLTITALGDVFNSKSTNEAMGFIYSELEISFQDQKDYREREEEIDRIIQTYTDIEKKYMLRNEYLSLNGENIFCTIYENPEVMSVARGRAPLYDNEIAVTKFISQELGITIGDTVTVSTKEHKADFLVTGFFQTTNDVGRAFAMNSDGIKRMGVEDMEIGWVGYSIRDREHVTEIAEELNRRFGAVLECTADEDGTIDQLKMAVLAMKAVIYCLSVLFALVVVTMVCKKFFLQERTDLGIYKALGFPAGRLRLQFAVRFLIIALLSAVIGSALGVAFSAKLLSLLLRSIGISSMKVVFTADTFLVPVSFLGITFTLFAYLVSGKIREVDIRALITE